MVTKSRHGVVMAEFQVWTVLLNHGHPLSNRLGKDKTEPLNLFFLRTFWTNFGGLMLPRNELAILYPMFPFGHYTGLEYTLNKEVRGQKSYGSRLYYFVEGWVRGPVFIGLINFDIHH